MEQKNQNPVDFSQLTTEQIADLKKQLNESEKAKKAAIKAERDNYKRLVNEAVKEVFEPLVELSRNIRDAKSFTFATFDTLIALKTELYGVKERQQSHSFTSDNGITVKLGYRVNDNYDDTVNAGISKVYEYLKTLAKDTESAALVQSIMDLLKADDKGNLKASRVLELRKMANRINNEDFSDAIRIIEDSYKPVRSCQFVEVKFKDEHNREHSLPLSISAFDIEG